MWNQGRQCPEYYQYQHACLVCRADHPQIFCNQINQGVSPAWLNPRSSVPPSLYLQPWTKSQGKVVGSSRQWPPQAETPVPTGPPNRVSRDGSSPPILSLVSCRVRSYPSVGYSKALLAFLCHISAENGAKDSVDPTTTTPHLSLRIPLRMLSHRPVWGLGRASRCCGVASWLNRGSR